MLGVAWGTKACKVNRLLRECSGQTKTDMEETPKSLKSAFDSPTFGTDVSFYLDKPVGSASISPCGRDIVLAS